MPSAVTSASDPDRVEVVTSVQRRRILLPLKLRPPSRHGPRVDQGGGDGSRINRPH
jgi:hypothetical protein